MNVAVDFRIPDDNILIEQVPRTKAAIEAERGDPGTKRRWALRVSTSLHGLVLLNRWEADPCLTPPWRFWTCYYKTLANWPSLLARPIIHTTGIIHTMM